jgi:hypothetical protein
MQFLRYLLDAMLSAGALIASSALAEDAQQAAQRALLQRQQQHDEQVLRLQQWQQRLQTPPADTRRSMELERLHLQQQQRQDADHARQQTQMRVEQGVGTPAGGSAATDLPRLSREREMEGLRFRREREVLDRDGVLPR